jgi:hypothetical protein
MSSGANSEMLAKLGQVTTNAAESAAHVFFTISESALPLAEQAASLILDKTAMFSHCLGDSLYRLAKATKTASARQSLCSDVKVDAVGLADPSPQDKATRTDCSSHQRLK